MHDRQHLERILHIHGLTPSSSETQIRSLLLSAHYHETEVDTALMVLRNQLRVEDQVLTSLGTLMHTDKSLTPKQISDLLGVNVTAPTPAVKSNDKANSLDHHDLLVVFVLALMITLIGLGLAMYWWQLGPFHPVAAYVLPAN